MFSPIEIALDVFSFLSRLELEKCLLLAKSVQRIVDSHAKALPRHQLEDVSVVCAGTVRSFYFLV